MTTKQALNQALTLLDYPCEEHVEKVKQIITDTLMLMEYESNQSMDYYDSVKHTLDDDVDLPW